MVTPNYNYDDVTLMTYAMTRGVSLTLSSVRLRVLTRVFECSAPLRQRQVAPHLWRQSRRAQSLLHGGRVTARPALRRDCSRQSVALLDPFFYSHRAADAILYHKSTAIRYFFVRTDPKPSDIRYELGDEIDTASPSTVA